MGKSTASLSFPTSTLQHKATAVAEGITAAGERRQLGHFCISIHPIVFTSQLQRAKAKTEVPDGSLLQSGERLQFTGGAAEEGAGPNLHGSKMRTVL